MKWKSRKFLFTAFFLLIYAGTVVVFLIKKDPVILEYLKSINPILVFIILGYHGINVWQKKLY